MTKRVSTVVVGLDNSGKSTIINHLLVKQAIEIAPTVGFQAQTFRRHGVIYNILDMSGQSQCRTLWEKYYCDAKVGV